MVEQARLEAVGSGLAPMSDGWFVVHVAEAAWLTNDAFGARCAEAYAPFPHWQPARPASWHGLPWA